MKFNLKGVVEDTDRHGNVRIYFRAPGKGKVRIREKPGTPAFLKEVDCARAGIPYEPDELEPGKTKEKRTTRAKPTKARPGSLKWLCEIYFERGGAEVSAVTMERRRTILEGICELPHPLKGDPDPDYPTKGSLPFAGMRRTHVKELRDTRLDAPGAANNITKAVSAMFAWAIHAEIEGVEQNPAKGIKRLKSGDGWHTWEVPEILQFEERHARGTTARLALAIFTFTGLRLSDAAIFGRQHITQIHNKKTNEWEKWIRINPGKADNIRVGQQSVTVEIPLLPELEEELAFAPSDRLTFLTTEYGQPFSEKGLGNKMRQWCDEAGLPHCSAHGLRKAGASIAAENGATHEQLKAIFGWTTFQQPDLYIKKARRRKVAQAARKLLVIDRNENKIVPLSEGVEFGGTNSAKKANKNKR